MITDLKTDLFVRCLFCEPTSRESLLAVGRYEYATFAVLRASASMKSDAGSAGDLSNDGKESLELGRLRHTYSVY